MKRNRPILLTAAILVLAGAWLAWTSWSSSRASREPGATSGDLTIQAPARIDAHPDRMGAGLESASQEPGPDRGLGPPDPTRRFIEFTPEQRVEFARRGHGPGG